MYSLLLSFLIRLYCRFQIYNYFLKNKMVYLIMCYDHNKTEIGLLVIVLAIIFYVLWLVIEAYNLG